MLRAEAGTSSEGFLERPLDKEAFDELLKRTLHRLEDSESKREFEEMVKILYEKIQLRELQLQERCSGRRAREEELTTIQAAQREQEELLIEYDEEFHATKGALKGLTVKERAIEKIVEERRAALEEKISAQGEANFANYLQQHEEIFTSVKKTYGKGV